MAIKQITLDDIRQAVEERYGPFEIDLGGGEVVRLVNILQLPKSKRQEIVAAQERMNGDGADQEEEIEKILRLCAETDGQANKLMRALGGNLPAMVEVFRQYAEATQVGEASPSQS